MPRYTEEQLLTAFNKADISGFSVYYQKDNPQASEQFQEIIETILNDDSNAASQASAKFVRLKKIPIVLIDHSPEEDGFYGCVEWVSEQEARHVIINMHPKPEHILSFTRHEFIHTLSKYPFELGVLKNFVACWIDEGRQFLSTCQGDFTLSAQERTYLYNVYINPWAYVQQGDLSAQIEQADRYLHRKAPLPDFPTFSDLSEADIRNLGEEILPHFTTEAARFPDVTLKNNSALNSYECYYKRLVKRASNRALSQQIISSRTRMLDSIAQNVFNTAAEHFIPQNQTLLNTHVSTSINSLDDRPSIPAITNVVSHELDNTPPMQAVLSNQNTLPNVTPISPSIGVASNISAAIPLPAPGESLCLVHTHLPKNANINSELQLFLQTPVDAPIGENKFKFTAVKKQGNGYFKGTFELDMSTGKTNSVRVWERLKHPQRTLTVLKTKNFWAFNRVKIMRYGGGAISLTLAAWDIKCRENEFKQRFPDSTDGENLLHAVAQFSIDTAFYSAAGRGLAAMGLSSIPITACLMVVPIIGEACYQMRFYDPNAFLIEHEHYRQAIADPITASVARAAYPGGENPQSKALEKIRLHCISKELPPAYMAEMERRYMAGDDSLLNMIAGEETLIKWLSYPVGYVWGSIKHQVNLQKRQAEMWVNGMCTAYRKTDEFLASLPENVKSGLTKLKDQLLQFHQAGMERARADGYFSTNRQENNFSQQPDQQPVVPFDVNQPKHGSAVPDAVEGFLENTFGRVSRPKQVDGQHRPSIEIPQPGRWPLMEEIAAQHNNKMSQTTSVEGEQTTDAQDEVVEQTPIDINTPGATTNTARQFPIPSTAQLHLARDHVLPKRPSVRDRFGFTPSIGVNGDSFLTINLTFGNSVGVPLQPRMSVSEFSDWDYQQVSPPPPPPGDGNIFVQVGLWIACNVGANKLDAPAKNNNEDLVKNAKSDVSKVSDDEFHQRLEPASDKASDHWRSWYQIYNDLEFVEGKLKKNIGRIDEVKEGTYSEINTKKTHKKLVKYAEELQQYEQIMRDRLDSRFKPLYESVNQELLNNDLTISEDDLVRLLAFMPWQYKMALFNTCSSSNNYEDEERQFYQSILINSFANNELKTPGLIDNPIQERLVRNLCALYSEDDSNLCMMSSFHAMYEFLASGNPSTLFADESGVSPSPTAAPDDAQIRALAGIYMQLIFNCDNYHAYGLSNIPELTQVDHERSMGHLGQTMIEFCKGQLDKIHTCMATGEGCDQIISATLAHLDQLESSLKDKGDHHAGSKKGNAYRDLYAVIYNEGGLVASLEALNDLACSDALSLAPIVRAEALIAVYNDYHNAEEILSEVPLEEQNNCRYQLCNHAVKLNNGCYYDAMVASHLALGLAQQELAGLTPENSENMTVEEIQQLEQQQLVVTLTEELVHEANKRYAGAIVTNVNTAKTFLLAVFSDLADFYDHEGAQELARWCSKISMVLPDRLISASAYYIADVIGDEHAAAAFWQHLSSPAECGLLDTMSVSANCANLFFHAGKYLWGSKPTFAGVTLDMDVAASITQHICTTVDAAALANNSYSFFIDPKTSVSCTGLLSQGLGLIKALQPYIFEPSHNANTLFIRDITFSLSAAVLSMLSGAGEFVATIKALELVWDVGKHVLGLNDKRAQVNHSSDLQQLYHIAKNKPPLVAMKALNDALDAKRWYSHSSYWDMPDDRSLLVDLREACIAKYAYAAMSGTLSDMRNAVSVLECLSKNSIFLSTSRDAFINLLIQISLKENNYSKALMIANDSERFWDLHLSDLIQLGRLKRPKSQIAQIECKKALYEEDYNTIFSQADAWICDDPANSNQYEAVKKAAGDEIEFIQERAKIRSEIKVVIKESNMYHELLRYFSKHKNMETQRIHDCVGFDAELTSGLAKRIIKELLIHIKSDISGMNTLFDNKARIHVVFIGDETLNFVIRFQHSLSPNKVTLRVIPLLKQDEQLASNFVNVLKTDELLSAAFEAGKITVSTDTSHIAYDTDAKLFAGLTHEFSIKPSISLCETVMENCILSNSMTDDDNPAPEKQLHNLIQWRAQFNQVTFQGEDGFMVVLYHAIRNINDDIHNNHCCLPAVIRDKISAITSLDDMYATLRTILVTRSDTYKEGLVACVELLDKHGNITKSHPHYQLVTHIDHKLENEASLKEKINSVLSLENTELWDQVFYGYLERYIVPDNEVLGFYPCALELVHHFGIGLNVRHPDLETTSEIYDSLNKDLTLTLLRYFDGNTIKNHRFEIDYLGWMAINKFVSHFQDITLSLGSLYFQQPINFYEFLSVEASNEHKAAKIKKIYNLIVTTIREDNNICTAMAYGDMAADNLLIILPHQSAEHAHQVVILNGEVKSFVQYLSDLTNLLESNLSDDLGDSAVKIDLTVHTLSQLNHPELSLFFIHCLAHAVDEILLAETITAYSEESTRLKLLTTTFNALISEPNMRETRLRPTLYRLPTPNHIYLDNKIGNNLFNVFIDAVCLCLRNHQNYWSEDLERQFGWLLDCENPRSADVTKEGIKQKLIVRIEGEPEFKKYLLDAFVYKWALSLTGISRCFEPSPFYIGYDHAKISEAYPENLAQQDYTKLLHEEIQRNVDLKAHLDNTYAVFIDNLKNNVNVDVSVQFIAVLARCLAMPIVLEDCDGDVIARHCDDTPAFFISLKTNEQLEFVAAQVRLGNDVRSKPSDLEQKGLVLPPIGHFRPTYSSAHQKHIFPPPQVMRRNILTLGLRIVEQPVDGNCLFHTAAETLENCTHVQLRKRTVTFMRDNVALFRSFTNGRDEEFLQRAETMAKDREWADMFEVFALAHFLDRPMAVIHRDINRNHLIFNPEGHNEPIFLYYTFQLHYDSLLPQEGQDPWEIFQRLVAEANEFRQNPQIVYHDDAACVKDVRITFAGKSRNVDEENNILQHVIFDIIMADAMQLNIMENRAADLQRKDEQGALNEAGQEELAALRRQIDNTYRDNQAATSESGLEAGMFGNSTQTATESNDCANAERSKYDASPKT